MSGVGISGLIANLPGTITPYPTQDPNLEFGGFRTDVQSITARNAIPANFRVEGMITYVRDTKCYYALGADLTTWGFLDSNQAEVGKQTTWVVNGVSGNDNNTGINAGSALATAEELARRLCPYGKRLDLSVSATVTFQANSIATSYGKMQLNVGSTTTTSRILTIQSEYTAGANILLTAVNSANPATTARAELVSASASFVAKKRVRNTTAGAKLGNLAVLSNLNGAATNCFVGTGWVNALTGSQVAPVAGETVAVDTLLVTFATIEITAHVNAVVILQDTIITRLITQTLSSAGSLTTNPFIWGCETSSAIASNVIQAFGGCTVEACRFPFDTVLSGDLINVVDCSFQATITVYSKDFVINTNTDSIVDAGSMLIGGDHAQVQTNVVIVGKIEHENGAGLTAWILQTGCNFTTGNPVWGVGGYLTGFRLDASAHINSSVGFAVGGLNFGSTNNITISGKVVSFSQCPITIPLVDAGVVFNASGGTSIPVNDIELNDGNSGAAVNVDFSKGLTHLVTLTANATVTMLAPPAACTVTLRLVEGGAGGFTLALAGLPVKGYTALAVTSVGAQNVLTMYWTGTNMLITSQVGYA